MNTLFEEFEPLVKLVAAILPLLVADAEIFESEGLRVSHIRAHASPYGIRTAARKLDDVQGVLNIRFKLGAVERNELRRHILTRNAHTDDGQRLRAQIFRKAEVLVIAHAERLPVMAVRRTEVIALVRRVHRPTVPVMLSALLLPDGIFP